MSKIVHTELISGNAKATADFFGKMFGWQVKKWDNPKMEYYTWSYPGEEMGGGGIGSAGEMGSKQGPHIDVYVDVDNISAAIDKAKSLGATQLMGETEIGGDMGYFAMLQIPGGLTLGIWAKNPSMKHKPQPAKSQKK
jgi:predicted enzyme related to lactoylglutathione lyase